MTARATWSGYGSTGGDLAICVSKPAHTCACKIKLYV